MPQTRPHPQPEAASALILPFPGCGPVTRQRAGSIETVLAYWDALRGSRSAPARAELDLGMIARALPWCFLAHRVAPGHARLRLAGGRIAALTGIDEPRGRDLGTLFTPASQAELFRAIRGLDHGARAGLALRLDPGSGRAPVAGRMLLLPLADGAGRLTHILGVVALDVPPPAGPCRFDLLPAAAQPSGAGIPAPRPGLRVIAGGLDQADPAP